MIEAENWSAYYFYYFLYKLSQILHRSLGLFLLFLFLPGAGKFYLTDLVP